MRLTHFLFGVRVLHAEKENLNELLAALLRLGITAEVAADGSITVSERDYKRLVKSGVKGFAAGERRGLVSLTLKALRSKGALIGALIAILINILAQLFVWDVRVEGAENISESALKEKLSRAGLEVGALWHNIDKNELEARLLDENTDLAWLALNRRGTVAYVRVIESREHIEENKTEAAGNIVADRDCIIEQITVRRGTAAVKVGDVVRAGDILISGVSDTPGGTVVEAAEGEVLGRAVRELSLFVPREDSTFDTERGKITALSVKLFKFEVNIFKKYRNSDERYDIIEAEKEFVLFGRCKLPLSIQYSYPVFREVRSIEYSESELVAIGAQRMRSAIYTLSRDCDILGISSGGEYTEDGYYSRSRVTYITEVGDFRELDID